MIVLAGDIGGTNSRLALYELVRTEDPHASIKIPKGVPLFERTYSSTTTPSLEDAAKAFLTEARATLGAQAAPERGCFAVAGPVENETARVTNLTWFVDAKRLQQELRIPRVRLANDFEAAAYGVTLMGPDDLVTLGGGRLRDPRGPVVVAGPGTGLGQAFLLWSEAAGGYDVVASEGGHADFAPRTALERGLCAYLSVRYGSVSWERVLSGPGLRDIFSFLLTDPAYRELSNAATREAMIAEDPAAVIVKEAIAGRDPLCTLAANVFISALGALVGNLALNVLATGGVFIAGGIAPRLVPLIEKTGLLREAFETKDRMQTLLSKMPLFIVTHREVGLLGAAALAVR